MAAIVEPTATCRLSIDSKSNELFTEIAAVRVPKQELARLFGEQQRLMTHFFDHLPLEAVSTCCEALLSCPGTIHLTGVGKSGFIAQKIAQILVSTGTRASFLAPTDALHGDIGSVHPGDVLMLLSKSGASEELTTLLPFVKARGARTIGVTCTPANALASACSLAVHLPLERELCPYNLAPVTSTAIQLIFGDTLAVALMNARGLSREEYSRNHPAGRIGKQLTLTVRSVMRTGAAVPAVVDQPVIESLATLTEKGCGCLLVVDAEDSGVVLGVFTDGDLRRAIQAEGGAGLQQPLSAFMTCGFKYTEPDAMAVDALQVMENTGAKVALLPVLEGGRLAGLVTLHSLVSAGI